MDLKNWKGCARPTADRFEGRTVLLERLDPARHGQALFETSNQPGAEERFLYLGETGTGDRERFETWLQQAASSADPLFYAVIDKASGKVCGRQTLMRIDAANGVIEIGNILWNPGVAGTTAATEALYLFARHVFDDLGYRRFEWKCNDRNEPSKRAALRFGFQFEGVFRQHMVVKGENRDTAWFSMIDRDWPALRAGYEAWLNADNFDAEGRQKQRLGEMIAAAR